VVFWWGALGSQQIQGFTARAFNLQGLINAIAQFLAAGAAADLFHRHSFFVWVRTIVLHGFPAPSAISIVSDPGWAISPGFFIWSL
jgi:hypothetical protein